MIHNVVAVFCGPHNDDGSISYARVDAAIEHALRHDLPLIVAGDGNCGSDVRHFISRAQAAGVLDTTGLYDQGRCTLSDAQQVVGKVAEMFPRRRVHMHLVTDWWHMSRAAIMLMGETRCACLEDLTIRCVNVEGPTPTTNILRGEAQGVTDYLAGTYGERTAYEPWGKPASQPQELHA